MDTVLFFLGEVLVVGLGRLAARFGGNEALQRIDENVYVVVVVAILDVRAVLRVLQVSLLLRRLRRLALRCGIYILESGYSISVP